MLLKDFLFFCFCLYGKALASIFHICDFILRPLQKDKKIIVFISHESTYTGASLVLHNLIKYIQQHTDWTPVIITRRHGKLASKFRQLCSYHKFDLVGSISLIRQLIRHKQRLILSNTITNGKIQYILRDLGITQVCYVHEMSHLINSFGEANLKLVKQSNDHFLACSSLVKQDLQNNHDIPSNQITIQNPFVSDSILEQMYPEKTLTKADLNINNKFVVGCIGNISWNKGFESFLFLAIHLLKHNDIHFVWVGSHPHNQRIQHDVNKSNLQNNFTLLPSTDNVFQYFPVFDIFVFPSREDSFGLVAIEAMLHKLPILTWRGGSGITDIIGNDYPYLCTYFSIEEMSNKILHLKNNPKELQLTGNHLYQKALAKTCNHLLNI